MDIPPTKKRRCRSGRSIAPYPTLFLPDELIIEILSFLRVKNIVQLKCLSKSWFTIISDPTFVEKHLKNSSKHPHLTLFWNQRKEGFNIASFPMNRLFKNPSITVYSRNLHRLKNHCIVVGSCNGLLCLVFQSYVHNKCWLRFLNPATKTRSKKLGLLCYSTPHYTSYSYYHSKFSFGYDASTRTYKVVVVHAEKNEASWKSEVEVFSLGNNCWRNIQSFTAVPLNWFNVHIRHSHLNDGVHFNGTINWMTYKSIIHAEQFQILSLDLSTETYKTFLLPSDFNGVPSLHIQQPVLRVLSDSLCFSHDSNETEFVLWHMKEYGVQESWTQLFKISYQNLRMHNILDGYQLACIYVNGDMVIFANEFRNWAFIYNLKDKTAEKIKTRNSIQWFRGAKDYVESLVPVH
ncbi:putative F-box domain-containing protein [Medicago truncatula]|uniref:F-box protein interaction domain protein n=1 Tax=Medicago truncatula TaxID=3880 RepID=A0A072U1P5_MEDTR|nr:F-box/kelch-repeat protein At3g23880 [Medicago truncatula]KEH23068.1 F-box protein interaction domain protein [Medicago truncatula]RHN46323.1 putative F-box domain-containing protein [Medicago truncatula]